MRCEFIEIFFTVFLMLFLFSLNFRVRLINCSGYFCTNIIYQASHAIVWYQCVAIQLLNKVLRSFMNYKFERKKCQHFLCLVTLWYIFPRCKSNIPLHIIVRILFGFLFILFAYAQFFFWRNAETCTVV